MFQGNMASLHGLKIKSDSHMAGLWQIVMCGTERERPPVPETLLSAQPFVSSLALIPIPLQTITR